MLSIADIETFCVDGDVDGNVSSLDALGGVRGLEAKLKTNFTTGLDSRDTADLDFRRQKYGRNRFPEPLSATWTQMFLESFEDTTLIILIVAAVVSFAVGFYEDPSKGWIEGAAILFAVLLVAVVTACNNYNKERQFRKLNAQKDDVEVNVLRDGRIQCLDIKELLVGDVVVLGAGDKVPTDGVLISGSDVTVNESSLTGEPEDLKKEPSGDVFLLSGTVFSTGYARMLCTAVGEQSRWGKTKAKLSAETVATPLQEKLDVLAGQIGNFGMISAVATFIAMIALWFLFPESREADTTLFEYALRAFIMGVTIVVVAVPEGLPLAVTLSLAYSTQKMMADNNLIRVLAACETMGNATNICSDKTGTLTQNRMTVVCGWFVGGYLSTSPTSADLPKKLVDWLSEGASVNSTANLIPALNPSEPPIVAGSKTEGALLIMLKTQFGVDYVPLRKLFDSARGDRLITFSSARKRMTTILLNGAKKSTGISYTKGAAEIVLANCTKYVNAKGNEVKLDAVTRKSIEATIETMAKQSLRAISMAHKTIDINGINDADSNLFETDMVLDAIVGIKDPLRPDVKEAVLNCQSAGIIVRMVTGDNIETAKAIAKECGILTEGGIAMEGPVFRKLSPAELDFIIPKLQVLARSSPDDKHTLVTRLNGHALPGTVAEWEAIHPGCVYETDKDLLLPGYREEWDKSRGTQGGEVVGVTGDGTNDGPALKAADVGLSMGLSGTDVAKEASDIVILDDNFSSIVKSVMWGRSVFDNIRKFLQFQLTVNVVALSLTFLCALTGRDPPLNAVMMLWVNMIMDTMGALALGTEPPSPSLLQRLPYKRNASLVSNKMLRNILVQFAFQMALLSYLVYGAAAHFGVEQDGREHISIVFNTFVFCQVFNELNARSIDDEGNVLKGIEKNPLFIAIIAFTVFAQVFIVQYGGDFVRTHALDFEQWQKCILLGSLTLPLGGLMRWIPVTDSLTDFAQVSDLIAANRKAGLANEAAKMNKSTGFSLSYLVWVTVCWILPVVAYQHFAEHWVPFVAPFLKPMFDRFFTHIPVVN